MTEQDRFFDKVSPEPTSGCWLWHACVNNNGYPKFSWGGVVGYAHRYAYKTFVGDIPAGKEIDHKCRVRSCVNPDHLETVTRRENVLRGTGPAVTRALHARITECPRGHPYTEKNTYRDRQSRRRYCRICLASAARERRRISNAKRAGQRVLLDQQEGGETA